MGGGEVLGRNSLWWGYELWSVVEVGRMGRYFGLRGGDRRYLVLNFWSRRE